MKSNEFIQWSQERIEECQTQQRALQAEGRGDEASFMQIRANVYGIFRTVCLALNGDMDKLVQRLEQIPSSWEASLHQAEAHGDMQKAHIERIKLETVREIRRVLKGVTWL